METQLKVLEENIADNFQTFNSPLTSISGIGPVLGAIILSEIGNFSRFDNGVKLAAYAGIYSTVKQSGELNGIHNRMSKRGSPYLRRAIWMAATVTTFNDLVLNEYYNKKRGLKVNIT